MTLDRTHLIVFIVGAILGILTGFFTGKSLYETHESVSVKRDTVMLHDTVTHYLPPPKDSVRTKWVTRWLPVAKNDTINHFVEVSKMIHDTVAVEVPITSKHYGSKDYDAWVSGYEPSLDSIKVYKDTQYITETIEVTKKTRRKPWGVGLQVGYGYDIKTKTAAPFVGIGISYDIVSF